MAEFIYTDASSIEGKIDTPHFPMWVPGPDEQPYISAISADDASSNQEQKEE